MQLPFFAQKRNLYTVSELNIQIKSLLETEFDSIWLQGEISNFHAHGSGHFYLSLKDQKSQISAVMFRGQNRLLKFTPEDGMNVQVRGRVSVYEPRGTYQIILDHMEPEGVGALQLAFEQLKEKLASEGLFDEGRKKNLPRYPKKIGVLTSATGAVIRDILHILKRRDPRIQVVLCDVPVQGEKAEGLLVEGLRNLQQLKDLDLIVLGRGGGSLEDLWAFNSEALAREIVKSPIPILSAVGHETDYTIADFVADLRAPTPSAAAELLSPVLRDLQEACLFWNEKLLKNIASLFAKKAQDLNYLSKRLKTPQRRLEESAQKLDELSLALQKAILRSCEQKKYDLLRLSDALNHLSPLNILGRGYSLTYLVEGKTETLLKSSLLVNPGDEIKVSLSDGAVWARVK